MSWQLARRIALWTSQMLPQTWKHLLGVRLPLSRSVYAAMLRSGGDVLVTGEGPAGGIHWKISPDTHRVCLLGTYLREVQDVLADRVRPGWIVYDLGANIGFFTLLMAKLAGEHGKVLAFEPAPAMRAELQRNVEVNEFNQVEILPYAIGDRDGPASFECGCSPLMSRLIEGGHRGSIQVERRTLDQLVFEDGLPAPHLIKMNIEGAEVQAIAGGKRLFAEFKPLLVCEVHSSGLLREAVGLLGPGWCVERLTGPGEIGYYFFWPAAA